ncbi:MAG: hypothetical protein MJ197_04475 [Bacteroidales bacterium]|nr:hypothetical protein [Bacteroidales bacterium]
MKIIALEYGHSVATLDESLVCYPDSTLIRNNDDFYVPNFSKNIVAYCGIYLQVTKIGKCVEPRFTNRYFNEVGAGIKFFAADVIERNKQNGTSTDIARSFDQSLAISNEKIQFSDKLEISAAINNTPIAIDETWKDYDTILSKATQYYTLKIGDLIFIPCTKQAIPTQIGDIFDIKIQGNQLLTCTIK